MKAKIGYLRPALMSAGPPMSGPSAKQKIRRLARYRHNWDFIDYDYLDKLNADDLTFLANFTEAHYQGPGSNRGKREHDSYSRDGRQNLDWVDVNCSDNLDPETLSMLKELVIVPKKTCNSR